MSVPAMAGSTKRQKEVRPTQRNRRRATILRTTRIRPSIGRALSQKIQPRRATPTRSMVSAVQRIRLGFTGPSPPIRFTKTARTRRRFVPRSKADAIHRKPSDTGREDPGRSPRASANALRNIPSKPGPSRSLIAGRRAIPLESVSPWPISKDGASKGLRGIDRCLLQRFRNAWGFGGRARFVRGNVHLGRGPMKDEMTPPTMGITHARVVLHSIDMARNEACDLVVDTGSTLSWVPGEVAARIGIQATE